MQRLPYPRLKQYVEDSTDLGSTFDSKVTMLYICPSLLETNLNKVKYSFNEKLSRDFSVTGSRFEEK